MQFPPKLVRRAPSRAARRRTMLLVLGVAAAALALTGCFGRGMWPTAAPLTSTQMPPGLWRSVGGSACTWARVAGGTTVGRNIRTNGPQYMQIEPSDSGVAIGDCVPFWQEPGPIARPIAQPGSPFGDGDFLVGYEITPGTYRATSASGQRCSWAVVRGFHGTDAAGRNPDFVRGDTTTAANPTAVIEPGDYGFTSQGCGQWQPTSPLPPAPGGVSTSAVQIDGVAEDFPDPFVMQVNDPTACRGAATCYFAYATESGFLGLINVPVIMSTDLVTWTWSATPVPSAAAGLVPRDAMPALAPWVQWGANWAPGVLHRPANLPSQQYVMYYTARSKASSSSGEQCIGIATSASPMGPFVDTSSTPALCNVAAGGTIDANPYVADDGAVYLQYSDNVGLRSQRLTPSGLDLAGGEQVIMHFDAGYSWELPRIEGPSMLSTPLTGIVLLYSAGTFDRATYSVGAARCDTPLGPCRQIYSTPVLSTRGSMEGPGGQTPFQKTDGSWELAFHAWDGPVGYPSGGVRTLHFLPLTLPGGNPAVG